MTRTKATNDLNPPGEAPVRRGARRDGIVVLCVGALCLTAAYIFVPEKRAEVVLAIGLGWGLVQSIARRVWGPIAALALSVAIPVCATGCANSAPVLSALELARKVGCATLCGANHDEP